MTRSELLEGCATSRQNLFLPSDPCAGYADGCAISSALMPKSSIRRRFLIFIDHPNFLQEIRGRRFCGGSSC
jgi:hypothetical protein